MNRRQLLVSGPAFGTLGLSAFASAEDRAGACGSATASFRVPVPELVYTCEVTIGPREEFGPTAEGVRRIIPITGGSFEGPSIRGTVVPGGADWNLTRSDGARSVEAAYYLRTDDGVTIRIVNKGVGDSRSETADETFAMFTIPVFEAPAGKYDWLNKSMFVATLGARKNAQNAVLIRVFKLT